MHWWSKPAWLLIAVALAGATTGCRENTSGSLQRRRSSPSPNPRPRPSRTISTLPATPRQLIPLHRCASGRVSRKNHFTDGSWVKKGDLLFTIQQDQYKAQLQQAEAQLAAQKASCGTLPQSLPATRRCLKKMPRRKLRWISGVIKKNRRRPGFSTPRPKSSSPSSISYTTVRAPFDGRIGRHLVNPGNVVGAMGQQTALGLIDQIDPIYVYFTINERDLLRVIERQKPTAGTTIDQRRIPVYFGLANENGYPHEGRLDFASINVAPTTGTLQLRGIFPNPNRTILPGLFVRVRALRCSSATPSFPGTRSASTSKANSFWWSTTRT